MWVAVAPLFVPDLLVGFTYRITATRLSSNVLATELLYAGLLLFRVVALQVVVRRLLEGSSVGPQSLHSWKLLRGSMEATQWRLGLFRLLMTGPWRVLGIAWLGGALLCFQDFETAALVQVDSHPGSWSVWLFDARKSNEVFSRILMFATWPLSAQLVLLAGVLLLIKRGSASLKANAKNADGLGVLRSSAVWCFLAVSVWAVVLWPFVSGGKEFAVGIASLAEQGTLLSYFGQVATSYAFCVLAAVASLWAAVSLQNTGARWWTLAALLPGLSGSLVLSLLLVAIVQLPSLNFIRDTWWPMVSGQTLWLLPRAWLLVWLLRSSVSNESLHGARLLLPSAERERRVVGAQLLWRLQGVRWLMAAAVLSHWAFWDVAVVSALRPVGFEPIVCRLYAEMHYDHTDTLMALTVMSVAFPVLSFVVAAAIGQWLAGRSFVRLWGRHKAA